MNEQLKRIEKKLEYIAGMSYVTLVAAVIVLIMICLTMMMGCGEATTDMQDRVILKGKVIYCYKNQSEHSLHATKYDLTITKHVVIGRQYYEDAIKESYDTMRVEKGIYQLAPLRKGSTLIRTVNSEGRVTNQCICL